MNETPNPKSQTTSGWSNWSPARKGRLLGATLGVAIAIGFELYVWKYPIRFPSFGIIVAAIVERPAIVIWTAMGRSASEASGKLRYVFALLLITVNALEGLLIGGVIGWGRMSSKDGQKEDTQ